jgi:hypothetical protein
MLKVGAVVGCGCFSCLVLTSSAAGLWGQRPSAAPSWNMRSDLFHGTTHQWGRWERERKRGYTIDFLVLVSLGLNGK